MFKHSIREVKFSLNQRIRTVLAYFSPYYYTNQLILKYRHMLHTGEEAYLVKYSLLTTKSNIKFRSL